MDLLAFVPRIFRVQICWLPYSIEGEVWATSPGLYAKLLKHRSSEKMNVGHPLPSGDRVCKVCPAVDRFYLVRASLEVFAAKETMKGKHAKEVCFWST